jgi:hypothetical protein
LARFNRPPFLFSTTTKASPKTILSHVAVLLMFSKQLTGVVVFTFSVGGSCLVVRLLSVFSSSAADGIMRTCRGRAAAV